MVKPSQVVALNGFEDTLRIFDATPWEDRPLGDPSHWPPPLRTVVAILQNTRHPSFCTWGPEHSLLFNRAPSDLSIHIIEDSQDVAELLRLILVHKGHQVHLAIDGPSGIESARTLGPDVILCDIGLPKMDGYQVAQAIRQDPQITPRSLIALSGFARPEDRQRALAAGFDHHLAKPLNEDLLDQLLSELAE